ncbi:restriction endonuclease subunit S [Cronobacter dublinensis]
MSFNSTPKELIEQNTNGLLSIHDSWQRIPMDAIAKITNGFAFKSSEFNTNKDGLPLIRIRDVLKGNTSTYYSGPVPEGYWVNPEDLIVGMDGDFNTTIWSSEPALLNQRVCKIDIDEEKYSKRFFFHTLPGYLSAINANTSSVTVKHLSSRTLQETLFPLPPLAEQKIIAEKLDTLLAQVDSTKARLEQIPKILKRFRQAVLAAVVDGKSVNTNTDKSTLTTLGSIAKNIKYGTSKKCSETQGSTAVLRIPNIGPGYIINSNLKYADFEQKELVALTLKAGDLLLIRSNGSVDLVGKVAVISENDTEYLYAGYLIRVRLNKERAAPKYISYCLQSPQLRQVIENIARSTSGVNNINSKELASLEIPLPPLPEQHEIVRRVEQLFAYADTIEKQVNNALTRVNNLTQSILAKAFRGELTAQWRAENPDLISGENSAAALLEKIKAERAASSGKKAARKKA